MQERGVWCCQRDEQKIKMTEQELIDQLQQGKNAAYRYLLSEYRLRVVNIAHSLLHSRDDAEEVAQDVFVEVFRSIASFRGESKLSTWLYRVAVNKSLNYKRSKRWSFFVQLDKVMQSDGVLIDNNTPTPEEHLLKNERNELLYKAIDSLPERQRIAFTLQKYENLSQEEIAQVMQTTVSAVESHLYRAKQELQRILEKKLRK